MNTIQYIILVLILTIFFIVLYKYQDISKMKEAYQTLLLSQNEHYSEMLNALYKVVKEEDNEGILICKYQLKEELKNLLPDLIDEIPICYFNENSIKNKT